MPPAATRVGSLGDIFVAADPQSRGDDPPGDALAGFDVVAQFSHALLSLQVTRSLRQHGVASLSAYLPWDTAALPAGLLAVVPPQLRLRLSVAPARLEVSLGDPYLAALRWPADVGGDGAGPVSTATAGHAHLLHERRTDVGWRVEINLLTRRVDVNTQGGAAPASRTPAADRADTSGVFTTGQSVAAGDGGWERLTLGVGRATCTAAVALDVPAGGWQFGTVLDFTEAVVAVSSDAPDVVEFLDGDAGNGLLVQALAPLRAAYGVRLSPPVAPAGPDAAAAVAHRAMPAFSVHDLLMPDQRGDPVLSLCGQLQGSTGGVARLVPVLLDGRDFAYAVSEAVLRPAYEVCWGVVANGVSFVGEMPVELPVGGDPNVTATGRAQIRTSFDTTLDGVSIKVTAAGRRDAVQLVVTQHVQLLNLWDHTGKRIADVGKLAQPIDVPAILPFNPLESGGAAPEALNPNLKDLLEKLVPVQVFPLLEPFPVRGQSVAGFCSAAMKTVLVRWALRTWRDEVVAPMPDTIKEMS
jgi:hypothetical protein